MKKLMALLTALLLMVALVPAQAETMAGGWTTGEDIAVTEEARAALDKALEGFVGSNIEPLALLGTQVVAGTNYCMLCRVTPVVPNGESTYALVYVWEKLDGTASILEIADVALGLNPAAE